MKHELHESPDVDGFAEFPPADDRPLGIDIVRAPSKGNLTLTILSEKGLGKYTHWYRGRTTPCLGDDCPQCVQAVDRRWHTWLVGFSEQSNRQFILELPAGAANDLAIFRRQQGSLRGYAIKVERIGGKVNSRVRLGVSTKRANLDLLPACPDLCEILGRMWATRRAGESALVSVEPLSVYSSDDREAGSASA